MDRRIVIGIALVVAAGAVAFSWRLVMRGPDPRTVESTLAATAPRDDAPSADEPVELMRDEPTIASASVHTPDVARTAVAPAKKPETPEEWRRFHLERALATFEASARDLRQGSATSVLAQSIATLLEFAGRGRPSAGGGPAERGAYNVHVGDRAYSFRADEYPEYARLQALLRDAPASGAVRDADLAETIVRRANEALKRERLAGAVRGRGVAEGGALAQAARRVPKRFVERFEKRLVFERKLLLRFEPLLKRVLVP